MSQTCGAALAPAPQPESAAPATLPLFPHPGQLDPELASFLQSASDQLCRWWAYADERSPLPLLSVLPEVSPEVNGLSAAGLLEDLQLVMDGAFNPLHPG